MSVAKNRVKKARRRAKVEEYHRISRNIRKGLYPRFVLRKMTLEDGKTEILEPRRLTYLNAPDGSRVYHKSGLTLRLVSVLHLLLGDDT